MRLLGLDYTSASVNGALDAYARLIGTATNRLADQLTANDWNFLYDVLSDVLDAESYPAVWGIEILCREVSDCARMGAAAGAWYGDDFPGQLARLLPILAQLGDLDSYAILLSVQHARRVKGLDRVHEDWWTVEHRTRATVIERIAASG